MFLTIIVTFINVANGSNIGPRGIPWKGIHFWRFWQSENGNLIEKVMIINEKKEPIKISFMIAHTVDGPLESIKIITDSSLGIVGGPWSIPASNYQTFYMPKIADLLNNGDYYYKIQCNISDKFGYIDVNDAKPKGLYPKDKIITTTGVDQVGGTNGSYWWEHNSFFAKSGEEVHIHFSFIPKYFDPNSLNDCFIDFKDPSDTTTREPIIPLILLKVNSGILPVESKILNQGLPNEWKRMEIQFPTVSDSMKFKNNYSVDFIFKAPEAAVPEYHFYRSLTKRGVTGSVFFIPLIVLPK